jgi:hypothetical protein
MPASDIYSAGIVLFQMLAGTVPFTGDSPVVVAHRHLTQVVPPVADLVPNVPPALAAVVARATAKDPHLRYPGAAEMEAAVRATFGAIPNRSTTAVLPAPTPPLEPLAGTDRPRRYGQTPWIVAAATAIVAIALLIGGLLVTDTSSPPTADAAKSSQPTPTEQATPPGQNANVPSTEDRSSKSVHRETKPGKKHKGPPHKRGKQHAKGHSKHDDHPGKSD